jgi:NCAIR mutase (PurE)-related protein
MDVRTLLEQVKNGKTSITHAEEILKKLPYEDLGFAKLDHHRTLRSGFGEVVFCQGKSDDQLVEIMKHLYEQDANVLGTRATREQYEKVREVLPAVEYDPTSRILSIQNNKKKRYGCIAVCTGGTSDIPVAEEAAQTALYFGSNVIRIYDVGVAGVHRLLYKIDEIKKANCIIAVAGMEGALGGVIAGLVDKPVIAVPTSVGYGANFNGISALLTMLNSCAEGLAVVNIDNGFGAGYIATQINRLGYESMNRQEEI